MANSSNKNNFKKESDHSRFSLIIYYKAEFAHEFNAFPDKGKLYRGYKSKPNEGLEMLRELANKRKKFFRHARIYENRIEIETIKGE